ncbi:DUF3108 domain-containing protein [Pseudenhygromyxa sp. WMMC2535]|uniref:DUF3108 domain-containing protein n=1 Tax=Pseudenhygromyxa sp. WMMC2535 TaxID=2712867 RepID=UPI001595CD8D|nr:DUF3108 domain-containing protein [Pseudenhygromyxa sp. WMMC2535]NVB40237.1 DUF3108 domain-containing protein [Pseudenhygromyxa sp. WMMC2535]
MDTAGGGRDGGDRRTSLTSEAMAPTSASSGPICAVPRRRALTTWLGLALAAVIPLSAGASAPKPNGPGSKRDQTQITRQATAEARERASMRRAGEQSGEPIARRQSDASRLPRMRSPTVQVAGGDQDAAVVGWSAALDEPAFNDRRRRLPQTPVPAPYADKVRVGERFVFDVFFAGNPAGLAEAGVVEYVADPRGEAPQGSGLLTIEGRAVTSGVVSLLTSMEDRMTTQIDAGTGAVVSNVNVIDRSGLGTSKYKRRITETEFEGRGAIRITDAKDEKTTKVTFQVPRDTFDPLSAMAWVRSLDLDEGDRIQAHVLDGKVLLKVEVVGRGQGKLDPMPSVAQGLGVEQEDVRLLEGTLSRVDRWGVVREDKRKYSFRAYVTKDERRLLLAIETDMWLGVLRLVLNRYDPPNQPR